MKYFFLVSLLAIGTYLIRCSFIILGDKISIHENIKLGLGFLTITILPALVFPNVIIESIDLGSVHPRIWASLFAIGISLVSKNILITMIGGFTLLIFIS